MLGADDPAGHCHAGAPADQLRRVPGVQGRGAQRHRRQAVRLDRGRLLRGAAVVWHEHANDAGDEAILFSIQDIPIMKQMALYREEPYAENAGHQPVTGHFKG